MKREAYQGEICPQRIAIVEARLAQGTKRDFHREEGGGRRDVCFLEQARHPGMAQADSPERTEAVLDLLPPVATPAIEANLAQNMLGDGTQQIALLLT